MNVFRLPSTLSRPVSELPRLFNRRRTTGVDLRFFLTPARTAAPDGAAPDGAAPDLQVRTERKARAMKDGEYTFKRRDQNDHQKGAPDGRQSAIEAKAASFRFRRRMDPRHRRDQDPSKSASPQGPTSTDENVDDLKTPIRMSKEHWAIDKAALKQKFGGDGWLPRKKISPDTMEVIRSLHEGEPEKYTTPVLANQFEISPEAIRRILKSKWSSSASEEKMEERRARWARRHDRIWDSKAELGLRPERTTDRKPEDNESQDQIMSYVTRPNL